MSKKNTPAARAMHKLHDEVMNKETDEQIYCRVQHEYDKEDVKSVYDELRTDDMPEELSDDDVEEIAYYFRDHHDWTNADYDAMCTLVQDKIEELQINHER